MDYPKPSMAFLLANHGNERLHENFTVAWDILIRMKLRVR